jgi:hypothetical protein
VAAVNDTTTKMLGAIVKAAAASSGDAAAVSQAIQLLHGLAETAVQCAEQTITTAGQAADPAAVQRLLKAELDMVVPLLVHLLAMQGLPSGAEAAKSAATDVCLLLCKTMAKGLTHDLSSVRPATLGAMVKLGQGLCTAGSSGGSALFVGCLGSCGGAVLQALLHADATETEVQSAVAFYLLACRAVPEASQRTTLCSAIVPALIVLIGRGNASAGSSASKLAKGVSALAAKLCLSLAKDATLAGDFKLQAGRLTPELRATLEGGLRSAMAGAASPGPSPRARAGSTGSAGSRGGATPRRAAKPAIALKMDF